MFKKKKNNHKIKKLRIQLNVAIILLVSIIISGGFLLSGLSFNQIVWALGGNYNKQAGDQLNLSDWNNLPNDFVDQGGDKMEGDIDMNNNKITNLPAPSDDSEPATKDYVDSALANVGGGGDVFVNWGNWNCPGGTEQLYRGFAFDERYSQNGGGEAVCLQLPGDEGSSPGPKGPGDNYSDLLYPLGTGNATRMPPGIPARKEVKCAVCYNPQGACYERWYGDDCPGSSGFHPVYTGYAMGGYYTHASPSQRHCVDNQNFDASVNNQTWGKIWYGSVVWRNTDVGLYTEDSYLKCAMCCK